MAPLNGQALIFLSDLRPVEFRSKLIDPSIHKSVDRKDSGSIEVFVGLDGVP